MTANVRPSNRIQIRNLPAAVSKDEIDQLVGAYGTVKKSQLGMNTRVLCSNFITTFKHFPVKLFTACRSDWLCFAAHLC